MNIIGIMLDSFRQDHVSYYHGGKPVFEDVLACQTPNIDAFAGQSVVFENAYPDALPTIPVRAQIFTGQRTLTNRPWQPLAKEDVAASEILRARDYVCGLVTDCYHYLAPGMNYHRGFHSFRFIRGQEYDAWTSHPSQRNVDEYTNAHYDNVWRKRIGQFLSNTDGFNHPDDWFPAKVVDEAIEWLTRNRAHAQRDHGRLFGWFDSFDPHEPWDPPAEFDRYTDPNYQGRRLIMPMGGMAESWATAAEIKHIQGLYAGEAAFVDHCLGRLFQTLEELGYYEDSIIILMADHGHPLGDHGKFLKGGDRMYNELFKVPFMIRLPGGEGARRTEAIVQFHDLLPTLLEMVGLANESSAMHGRSFASVLRDETDTHREVIITGYHEAPDRCIRDLQWSYVQRPEGEPDELYALQDDPRERTNLIDEYPDEARRLSASFGQAFRGRGTDVRVKGIQGKYEMASGSVE